MTKKTYKREAAGASLLSVAATAAAAVGFDSETAVRVLEIITTPLTMFASAMFGADWMGKQSKWQKEENDELDYMGR